MKIAILSDIHSNLPALQAVMRDIDKQRVDQIITLGDIVGYGANPGECLELIMNDPRLLETVQGNHENGLIRHAIMEKNVKSRFNPEAWQGLMHSYRILGDDRIMSFVKWPQIRTLPELGITVAHGSVASSHAWDYVDKRDDMELHFAVAPSKISFIGHTHCPILIDDQDMLKYYYLGQPRELREDRNYLINVGSVGQPRKGDYRPCYGVLQIEGGVKTFLLRQIEYDVDAAVRAILDAKLPEFLANRLRQGK